jgi:hypothetical protein
MAGTTETTQRYSQMQVGELVKELHREWQDFYGQIPSASLSTEVTQQATKIENLIDVVSQKV